MGGEVILDGAAAELDAQDGFAVRAWFSPYVPESKPTIRPSYIFEQAGPKRYLRIWPAWQGWAEAVEWGWVLPEGAILLWDREAT